MLIFFALWEVVVSGGLMEYEYLPAPTAIARGLAGMIGHAELWEEAGHTLAAALLGWLIACGGGTAIGVILGLSPKARRYTLASVEMLRPLPGIAFVPVALLLFGFSIQMELLVIVVPVIWPALVNSMGGVMAVSQRLTDLARTLRLSPVSTIFNILLPAAAPAILVGARLALTLSLIMAVAAEMVGNPVGLGYAVVREQQSMHPDRMFGYVLIMGALGIGLDACLRGAARLMLPGEFRRLALQGARR
ncbi:MAG TPA: ABC transporter permease [Burkholderiales bacterium]|jgi:ABC-type nitrate/sulfonate/bicarbonate transport system permease component|nr:ABC transporter permease [Burkholderiales bacterium]